MALIVLDAAIPIALLDASDLHHSGAQAAVRDHLEEAADFRIPVTAYAEILVGPMKTGARAVTAVDALLADLPVHIEDATPDIAKVASGLRAKHGSKMRLPDAFVCATAEVLGANLILTADTQWPKLKIPVQVVRRRSSRPGRR